MWLAQARYQKGVQTMLDQWFSGEARSSPRALVLVPVMLFLVPVMLLLRDACVQPVMQHHLFAALQTNQLSDQ